MSQSTVSRARELLAKISQYPWLAEGVNILHFGGWKGIGSCKMAVDAEFCAAAPGLVSALADRVEVLEKALRDYAEQCEVEDCDEIGVWEGTDLEATWFYCGTHKAKSTYGVLNQRQVVARAALNEPKK